MSASSSKSPKFTLTSLPVNKKEAQIGKEQSESEIVVRGSKFQYSILIKRSK